MNIQLTRESKIQKLDFITWKDDRQSFYAKPSNGKHRVISLIAALPENPKWKGNPFPECAPMEITPCTLLPPRILEPSENDFPAFTVNEIKELKTFVAKLKKPADPISEYLYAKLTQVTSQQLDDYDESGAVSTALGKSLIEFLNNIINGSLIYDIKRFNEAKLRSKTEHLLKDNPKGEALVYLNRILLEDAYPLEIIKTPESANPKTKANCLYLTPEDDEPLNALLEESREEANRELIETKNALEKIKNEEEQLIETKNALEIKKITTKRILKERELATNDLKIDDLSKTTLEKIKEGDLGIRNDYLIECWAKRRKPDFEEMSQQRIELLDWLEKLDLLDAPQDQDDSIRGDINFQKHLARRKPFPAHRHFDQPMKHKWPDGLSDEVWWVLAKITHVIEFEDKKTFYLFDVDLREKLRHSELKELETLEKARTSTSNLVDDQYGTDMVLPEKVMPEFAALPKTLQRAFNFLIKPNPKKAGFALSLKTVGGELGCSSQTVLRYRREIGSRSKALGNIIAVERAKNDRKVSPEALAPPHSVDNDPENYVTM